jgi:hypothetical protein
MLSFDSVDNVNSGRIPETRYGWLYSDFLLIVGLVVVAMAIRFYLVQFPKVISADGVGYVNAARALLKGNVNPLGFYGIGYPSLLALAGQVVADLELAGRLLSSLLGSLIVIPLYLLGKEFFSKRTALLACILALSWSSLCHWSVEVMTQSTYITAILTGFYLVWRGYRLRSAKMALAGGLAMGCAYLTRPEALVAFAAIFAVLLLISIHNRLPVKQTILLSGSILAGFMVAFIPNMILIHHIYGTWQITGKSGATLADALGGYLNKPDLKNDPNFKGLGFMDVLRDYPDFAVANSWTNFKYVLANLLPWFGWAFALIGLISGGWDRIKTYERIYLIATFAPFSIIIVFFWVGPEYTQPYLPVIFLWVGNGLDSLERAAFRFLPVTALSAKIASLVIVAAFTLFSANIFYQQIPKDRNKPYHFEDDGGRYDQKLMGLMLQKHLPSGSKIMTRWGRIAFYYSDRDYTQMPQVELDEMISIARRERVNFIVADGMLMGIRPQFAQLYVPLLQGYETTMAVFNGNGPMVVPGLRLHLLYKNPASLGVAVYEVLY